MKTTNRNRKIRLYLYAVIVSAGPLATFYGFATADEVALWLGLGGTILGVPAGTVAVANLEPKPAPEVSLNLPAEPVPLPDAGATEDEYDGDDGVTRVEMPDYIEGDAERDAADERREPFRGNHGAIE